VKYVPIIDAGLAIVPDPSYQSLIDGLNQGVFIKSGNTHRQDMDSISPIKNLNGTLYGRVWPGYAAFPDWSNPKAEGYWIDELEKFHDVIDMNEIANFCTGACIPED
jgi:hypothetical protein